ncbi:MAG: GPW/gp25 family protein [Blastocatellia bacterium]|nr:GPW/gp25 family protein [Blastocatellia bacterium]
MNNPERAFLGTGWSFPPTFSRLTASVDMVSEDRDIQESLRILFSTALGERVMEPNYGSQLNRMVFHSVTTTFLTELEAIVAKAILYWEARITVDEVLAQPDAQINGLVTITVNYVIRTTNARNNFVYPFYLQEATIPGEAP